MDKTEDRAPKWADCVRFKRKCISDDNKKQCTYNLTLPLLTLRIPMRLRGERDTGNVRAVFRTKMINLTTHDSVILHHCPFICTI